MPVMNFGSGSRKILGKEKPVRALSYEDFEERFAVFADMEELDDEWVHTKEEFEKLYHEDTYEGISYRIYAIIGLFGTWL